jgi:uncharacterized damage-inducible protein DinB
MPQHFTELLHGRGAHADPLACIEDISSDLASKPIPGFPHSIAQLVFHMNYWMNYELQRIRCEKPHYPEHNAESFSAASVINDADWKNLRRDFSQLLAEFARLTDSPRSELDRPIESIYAEDQKVASTLEAVISQMIAHNSYHTGQIALIRRVLGAWPPPSGGDTW